MNTPNILFTGMRRRRVVTLCKHVYKRGQFGKGGHSPRLWAFSYEDLSFLFNLKIQTIRNYICQGLFDPTDLLSIVGFYNKLNDKVSMNEYAEHTISTLET